MVQVWVKGDVKAKCGLTPTVPPRLLQEKHPRALFRQKVARVIVDVLLLGALGRAICVGVCLD